MDNFAQDLFGRLAEMKESVDGEEVREIKTAILRERIDRIDKMNNIRKQYLSDYYIVVYGRNELDLENTTINVASEINKCGLNTKLLGRKETAIFLKYSFSRNFDEREIKEIEDNRLIAWVKPKKVEFKANSYTMDGTQAAVFAIADYPLRVRNAWGADVFNIPNTKVVLHVKPVDKFKAIKRIDKCIGEMETKQILSEKASEANSAETHRETMNALLDSLQTENESLLDVILLDYVNQDLEELSKQPKGTHIGQLGVSYLESLLPAQFLMSYDYNFLYIMKSKLIQLRKHAKWGHEIIAHSVLEEIILILVEEESEFLIESYENLELESDWKEWVYDVLGDADIDMFLYSDEYLSAEDSYHFLNWLEPQI